MEALKFVPSPKIRSLAKKLHKSDTMFRLGVADSPRQSVEDAGQKMFTLIQWNKALSFPRRGQEPEDLDQCITLAIMQLQFAFSTEMLIAQGGGMLVFDEAWTLLQTDFGLDMLQRMGRLGRSQGVLPVLATQRVSDVLRDGVDMEEHLSRVLVMKLQEERDQRAALKLCGIEDTDENLKLLADFGMRKPSDPGGFAPSRAFHRDLNGNHSVVHIAAALPDAAADAYNTNPNTKKEAQG
jgi:hypothetical protein